MESNEFEGAVERRTLSTSVPPLYHLSQGKCRLFLQNFSTVERNLLTKSRLVGPRAFSRSRSFSLALLCPWEASVVTMHPCQNGKQEMMSLESHDPVDSREQALGKVNAESLTLRDLQDQVDTWIRDVGVRYFSELTNLAVLVEEVGELSRILSRTYGDQSFKKTDTAHSLPDEMADVLFVLVCLANQTGVDLTRAMADNLAKKTARDAERHKNNPKLQSNPSKESALPS